jgi:hypothetical protein
VSLRFAHPNGLHKKSILEETGALLMMKMMTNTTTATAPNALLSNNKLAVLPQRGAPVGRTKHRLYPRRVVPRRLNILARQETTTTMTTSLYHQAANPTDVWPRFVRFVNPEERPATTTTTSVVTAPRDNNSNAVALPGDDNNRKEGHYYDTSRNDDQCWYSEKDYGRIIAENQRIIEISRKNMDQQGYIDEELIPNLKGLECYLSPEDGERRQRQVTDHVRRMLSATTTALRTIG